jgi:hypothetical protein
MTDTSAVPNGVPSGVTDAQFAAELQHGVQQGYWSESDAESTMPGWRGHLAQPAKPAQQPSGAHEADTAAGAPDPRLGGFTPEQYAQIAREAVQSGQMTEAEMQADLQRLGIAPQQTADPVGDHLRSLGPGFEPAADPGQYQLPQLGDSSTPVGDLATADKEFRGWMHTARLPVAIGNAIAEEAARVAARLDGMSDVERELWGKEQRTQLAQVWGKDFESRMDLAKQLVAEVNEKTDGKLRDWLNETGVGDSALVAMWLGEHGYRISLRGQG